MNVTLHLVDCDHAGNPAWAQNDAMMTAYMDNVAYFFRVGGLFSTVSVNSVEVGKIVTHVPTLSFGERGLVQDGFPI